jgi:hypothetical protein
MAEALIHTPSCLQTLSFAMDTGRRDGTRILGTLRGRGDGAKFDMRDKYPDEVIQAPARRTRAAPAPPTAAAATATTPAAPPLAVTTPGAPPPASAPVVAQAAPATSSGRRPAALATLAPEQRTTGVVTRAATAVVQGAVAPAPLSLAPAPSDALTSPSTAPATSRERQGATLAALPPARIARGAVTRTSAALTSAPVSAERAQSPATMSDATPSCVASLAALVPASRSSPGATATAQQAEAGVATVALGVVPTTTSQAPFASGSPTSVVAEVTFIPGTPRARAAAAVAAASAALSSRSPVRMAELAVAVQVEAELVHADRGAANDISGKREFKFALIDEAGSVDYELEGQHLLDPKELLPQVRIGSLSAMKGCVILFSV